MSSIQEIGFGMVSELEKIPKKNRAKRMHKHLCQAKI